VRTLAGRVTLLVTLATALVLAAVAIVAVTEVARRERAALDRELRTTADRLAAPARRAIAAPQLADRPQSPLASVPGTLSVRLLRRGEVVFDDLRSPGVPVPAANGLTTVTASSGEPVPGGTAAPSPGAAAPGANGSAPASSGRWRVLVRTVRPRANGQLVVSTPLAPLEQRVRDLRRVIALAALVGLLALALAARILTTRALRPLQRLRESAASVSTTRDLTTRVATSGPEEVDDVARSLNAMLARLEASSAATEQALEAARRFTADAGHELRTPLTSIRANLAALHHGRDENALAELERDLVRLAALLDGLQALARGDAGATGHTPVDVGEVADAALADARRRHPEVDFAFAEDTGELTIEGDENGLRAALDNLLENAARHGAHTVRVTIEAHRVLVDDDGPGIPAEDRERVFERFARGATTTAPGSGLGLAVVAQQAALHGGTAHAEASPLGGARLVVELKENVKGPVPFR
jgi:two-component system sensor histidine kinase PrrB